MSKLTKLCGKLVEKVELGEGENKVELILKVPKVEDLADIAVLFQENKEVDKLTPEQLKTVVNIIRGVLKNSDPEATDEEINEVIVSNLGILMEAVMSLLQKSFKVDEKKN